MNKYKVTYEYRGRVTVEVNAADEEEAEKRGRAEADELIHANLTHEATIRRVEQGEPL